MIPSAPRRDTQGRSLAERLTLVGLGCLFFAYAYWLSRAFGKSSDQANLLLAGVDMLHGNWRLRGWSMVADSYWTTDVALGALLSGLRWAVGLPEVSPLTLVLQPALSWAALVMAAIVIAQQDAGSPARRWSAALVVLAALGVPVMREAGVAPLAFLSGIHILTILCALLAFLAGRAALIGPDARWALAACAAFVVLGAAGDPLMVFIGIVPLLAAIPFARAIRPSRRVMLAVVVATAALLARIVIRANAATGGFTVAGLPLEFARFDDLGSNLGVALHGVLAAFSADFTDRPVAAAVPDVAHLPVLLLAGSLTGLWLARLLRSVSARRFGEYDLMALCLALGTAIDFAALVFSRRVEYEHASLATARYLFPAWAFASTLLARQAAGMLTVRLGSAAALATALAFNRGPIGEASFPALSRGEAALLDALDRQPVRVGLAGYWQAALLQVASRNRLRLEACIADASGQLVPMRNANKVFAVSDIAAGDFVVVVLTPRLYFDAADTVRSFGPPARTQTLPGFTLMFYHGRPPPVRVPG